MRTFQGLVLFVLSALLLIVPSHAAPPCPFMGPVFLKPQHLSANAAIQAAVANLTATFQAFGKGNSTAATNNSWSVEVWSVNEAKPLFSDYHTASNLPTLNSSGVTKVDENTVYRLGSFTKVFTVLTWLAQDGDIKWTAPITKYVPELVTIKAEQEEDPARNNDWDSVTIGALLSQMSGIIRDYSLLGELTQKYSDELLAIGFPPLPPSEVPTCGQWPVCNRTEFFEGLRKLPPTFPPSSQPAYSNIAYQLAAYALENIVGKSWEAILTEKVLKPLELKHTYYRWPNQTADSIIPGNLTETGWINQLGDESPAGSMYASSADLTTVGKAILSSKLMPKAVTQRWIKPVSFTSDPQAGMGIPWGIRRINLEGHPYRNTYGYQKAGRIGDYASYFLLLPDWDVGMTILIAGDIPVNLNFEFADLIGEQLIPKFEQTAREEAQAMFGGHYRLSTPSSNSTTNSSMTIITDSEPGLRISSWISNGTDMTQVFTRLHTGATGDDVKPRVRLYPSDLVTTRSDGTKTMSMRAVFEDENTPSRAGRMFSADCASWLAVTSETYGRYPTDDLLFHFDAAGKVVSVEPLALRAVMSKVS